MKRFVVFRCELNIWSIVRECDTFLEAVEEREATIPTITHEGVSLKIFESHDTLLAYYYALNERQRADQHLERRRAG